MCHDMCPMPISTDGVMLGAWADVKDAKTILDIGTGCGLIALMLAQRSKSARINAIDINADAVMQAEYNFARSPWSERLTCEKCDFLKFSDTCKVKYDLIVSNPPFYIEDTLSPNMDRATARNAKSLPLQLLVERCAKLLSENGMLCIITPFSAIPIIENAVDLTSLTINQRLFVKPTPDKSPHRVLWQIGKRNKIMTEDNEIAIELSRHKYTQEYINLTHEFYIKM